MFLVDLRTIVRDGECLLGHVNEIRSYDTVKFGTFLPPNYHCFLAACAAHWCVSPVLVGVRKFVAVTAGLFHLQSLMNSHFHCLMLWNRRPPKAGPPPLVLCSNRPYCSGTTGAIITIDVRQWRNKGGGCCGAKVAPILTYLLIYLLTYSMEQSPLWEANRVCG